MIRSIFSIIAFTVVTSYGAQGSGFYFEANASQGKMKGDTLFHFEGPGRIGVIEKDSACVLADGKEVKEKFIISLFTKNPVNFQYAVRYSFLAGYEHSFNKVISIRASIGYQKALLDAHASVIENYGKSNQKEVPFISAEIDRNYISIPIDFKVTLPIRRSGLYLAAGPKASILLSSTYSDSITGYTENLGNLTPRFNLGLGFRFGAEIAIANAGFLIIESGYHKGLLNTSIVSSANTQEGEIVPIGFGFRMNLPK
jgi:hypothetical protein